ncbi:MAG TPA: hypothetical protein VGX16_03590, partial [Solirubrobacteraceae bacterium]|nr:hypothetical protein [Solirubrobacteraceae bacterium]
MRGAPSGGVDVEGVEVEDAGVAGIDAGEDVAEGARTEGARAVWRTAAALGVVLAGLLIWQLALPRPYYTGTNSVGFASIVATVPKGQSICLPELNLPAETGAVRLALLAQRPSVRALVRVSAASGTTISTASAPTGAGNRANLDFPIPVRPATPASVPASLCVTPLDGEVQVGGTGNLQYGQAPARIGRTPVPNRIAVWYLPPHGRERSLLESAGAIFSRAALFRPGIVGAWTYPFLLLLLLPALWLLSLLLLAR